MLRHDLKAAVDYLRNSQLVDGSKIIVVGHSMGAGARLDLANHDAGFAGSVMISGASGGFSLWGPERPRNALFIFAEHDPDFLRSLSMALAANLSGVEQVELGKIDGDPAKGNAVEAVRIAGFDHATILVSDEAATTIVKWLDSVTGTRRAGEIYAAAPEQQLKREKERQQKQTPAFPSGQRTGSGRSSRCSRLRPTARRATSG